MHSGPLRQCDSAVKIGWPGRASQASLFDCLSPQVASRFIPEFSHDDENEVQQYRQNPDSRQQHEQQHPQNPRPHFACIEAVDSQTAQKQAQEEGNPPVLIAGVSEGRFAGGGNPRSAEGAVITCRLTAAAWAVASGRGGPAAVGTDNAIEFMPAVGTPHFLHLFLF